MQAKSSLDFAGRLSLALAGAGMKAATLAAKSQVSKGYVSDLLKRKKEFPSAETCKKFSEVLGVPQVWLYLGEGNLPGNEGNPKDHPEPPSKEISEDAALFPNASLHELEEARRKLSTIEDALTPYRAYQAKMAAFQAAFTDSIYARLRGHMQLANAWPPTGEDDSLSFTQLWEKYAPPP